MCFPLVFSLPSTNYPRNSHPAFDRARFSVSNFQTTFKYTLPAWNKTHFLPSSPFDTSPPSNFLPRYSFNFFRGDRRVSSTFLQIHHLDTSFDFPPKIECRRSPAPGIYTIYFAFVRPQNPLPIIVPPMLMLSSPLQSDGPLTFRYDFGLSDFFTASAGFFRRLRLRRVLNFPAVKVAGRTISESHLRTTRILLLPGIRTQPKRAILRVLLRIFPAHPHVRLTFSAVLQVSKDLFRWMNSECFQLTRGSRERTADSAAYYPKLRKTRSVRNFSRVTRQTTA